MSDVGSCAVCSVESCGSTHNTQVNSEVVCGERHTQVSSTRSQLDTDRCTFAYTFHWHMTSSGDSAVDLRLDLVDATDAAS